MTATYFRLENEIFSVLVISIESRFGEKNTSVHIYNSENKDGKDGELLLDFHALSN